MATSPESASIEVKKDVRIVKKQATTKKETIENGKQNGDAEAAVTVKLPAQASAAKTETNVEVVQKTLPDGSLQEITTTTTKTTIDGRTEIRTKTETKTIPKAVEEEEEVEESEEEVEETNGEVEQSVKKVSEEVVEEEVVNNDSTQNNAKEKKGNLIVNEERSETTTTTAKKVMFVESTNDKTNKEEDEEEEEEEEVIEEEVIKKDSQKEENDGVMMEEENVNIQQSSEKVVDVEESGVEEVIESTEETNKDNEESVKKEEKTTEEAAPVVQSDHEESEYTEEEYESEEEEPKKEEPNVKEESKIEEKIEETAECTEDEKEDGDVEESPEIEESEKVVETEKKSTSVVENEVESETTKEEETKEEQQKIEDQEKEVEQKTETKEIKVEVKLEANEEKSAPSEHRIPIREPSVPLEKVEDVEIKPLTGQDFVSKSHTERTEIITSSNEKPTGPLSTQTEFNRVENVVTVNRLTKTLDRHFEDYVQPTTIPSLSTYFSQMPRSTPQPAYTPVQKPPYTPVQQPVYTPDPGTERRHSLLLERLSVERQLPVTELYQNQYNTHISDEQQQWSEEPRVQVLSVDNVKPSAVTKNQQWYQYSQNKENITNSINAPISPSVPSHQWNQPQTQYQQKYQPKPQPQIQPQPILKPTTPIQSDHSYKSSYTENTINDNRTSSNIYTSNLQQNSYSSYLSPNTEYTPKPDWSSNVPVGNQQSNYSTQYSSNTDYQSAQSYPSSYVPPPWEQDSRYAAADQTQYQPAPAPTFSPSLNQPWQSTQKPKYTKPPPTAYIPPAPNQSFVAPVTPTPPKTSGRKTYYSEYERRYISVPESNYVPTETKYQHQPDPSPVYYYNTEEPTSEPTEPEWRRELREFTEKSKTQTYTEQTSSVRPPWEETSAKPPQSSYTPTPTWSQTLRPRSYREKSYEAEFTGSQTQEWPKANTMGRSRPLSTYEKNDYDTPPQRVRGVSVDRYNPNNYQSPIPGEHPPVLSQTLTPQNAPHKTHPHVPAYHSRASAEPRDAPPSSYKQPSRWADSRAPFQSRSFKYLQWITGTED